MLDLAVAVAAGLGSVCRYLLDRVVQHRTGRDFPFGTLLVNVSGSLLLGLVTGLALRGGLPPAPTVVLGVGFAGGYTTLSTWAWESIALAESGQARSALLNIVAALALGIAAAAAGLALTRL